MTQRKSKRKKKTHGIQVHQQMLNSHKKEYSQRLEKIVKASGAYEIFKQIPKKELIILEHFKASSFKVIEANTNLLSKNDLKELRSYVADFMKMQMLTIK